MNKLDLAERQVLQNAQDMQQLLDENLLWVRSSQKLSLAALENFREELDLLSKPQPWSEAANIIFSWRAESSVALLVALLAVLIWISSAWIKRGLAAAAYQSQHEQAQSIRPSLTALLLTLIRALPFPILLMAFSLQLANLELDRIIANNLHQLTLTLAPLAFGLLLFKHLCDQNGLARVHFSWSENSIARLTRATRWLLLLALPLGIVSSLAFEVEYFANNQNNLIPKTALLGALITLAYTLWYLFNPRKGVLRSYAMLHPDHSLNRSHYVWFGLLMLYQAALIVLVVLGYNYTAGIFARYLVQTLLLFGLITLMYHLAIRWLRIMRYRLAMQAWQEKQAAKQEAPTSADSDSSGDIAALEEQSIDLGSLNEQTRKLIKLLLALLTTLGLWLIWSSVLPALNILDDVSLWHHMRVVNGEEKLVPVTLVDLFMSIAVIAITVFAAKNLPMLLEALLLQRFSLSSGSRYATTNLVTYSIAGIGIVLAFTSLGLSWSSIQWLVAALGVGIGFGLQEIVANFICGIIILFERPIRVGDVVSVGNVDGIVTKIRIRATTIRNWDRQELLVPNKEFITQQLLNWTLSDQTTRLLVPVGVAYGSDVRLASELMLKAAKQHPRVLDDPKATVFFETFGDNTLNLQMRCFIVTTHPLPDRTHLPGPSE
ncbi:MAG: mechanosensitive ion channel, partial [gamma proteobacterium symbiont of Bathyaustriella thionipta]|nr:mechanosensitive ion channel [gamma proteobacterium symbiont of Bathyaustriella thionipta]